MRWRGWFRLWVFVSIIGVPIVTFVSAQSYFNTWKELDRITIQQCSDEESRPPYPDAFKCARQHGAMTPYFERDHTTALAFWGEGLGGFLVLDVLLTLVLVGLALFVSWVW